MRVILKVINLVSAKLSPEFIFGGTVKISLCNYILHKFLYYLLLVFSDVLLSHIVNILCNLFTLCIICALFALCNFLLHASNVILKHLHSVVTKLLVVLDPGPLGPWSPMYI